MERLIHLLIFPLVIASASAVEINLPASTEMLQSIDSVINEAVNKSKIPGGVIWLEREGNKYHKAYGHQSLIPVKRVMKNNSIFDAASLTKVMATAPSIMILVEQGRIALDDPVRKHLPEFIGGNKNKVTIIIPVFNEKNYIKEIIDRVKKNVNFKKQIIIVDDCSSDGTRDIIKKFKNIKRNFGTI